MSGRKCFFWIPGVVSFLLFLNSSVSYSQIIINEVCASNADVIEDSEGDFGDWIEIVNRGSTPVNLAEYCLSDKRIYLEKWCFPEYLISPGEHLIVFASGKNITSLPLKWHTIIKHGDDWKYILPDVNTPLNWRNTGFDDSSWNTGPSGFGYGDNDDATVIPSTISLFIRKGFNVEEPSRVSGCVVHMDYDDGFVAFINGTEVARSGVAGHPPGYSATALSGREATMYNGGDPEQFDVLNYSDLLLQGENVIAVQIHNVSNTSSDLSAIPFLSLRNPQKSIEYPPDILNLINTRFHTNFKLNADGDSLYLTNPAGIILDSVYIPLMNVNYSYGRRKNEPDKWVVFETATPENLNNTPFFEGFVEDLPDFSTPGGRFSNPFQLSISALNPEDSIFYSLDGTEPTIHSLMVQDVLEVSSDMVVRARIIRTGFVPGKIITNTYFTGNDNHIPVVTISTDPYNLWDHYNGIYTEGPDAENDFPYFGANFWQDWEKPAHVELYDEDGYRTVNIDAGIKIYGGWTRGRPQKSMAIYARSKYGAKKIEAQLFKDKPIHEFESFIIRNSGNDWFGIESESGTMFRDVLMTRLTREMDVEHLASRQAIVYINGEYWGIQNIREKISEHFLASNRGVDPDQIDMLEGNHVILNGDSDHYASLISFLNSNSIQDEENYTYVKTRMEIQNFINYQLTEIFYGNTDWPSNNIKYWRPATPNGRWRWILYDTDFGFGLWDQNNVNNNTLLFATEPNGPDYPNPPWATYLLRRLLQNQEFKELFINSFADQINTSFKSESVIDQIDNLKSSINEEMFNHVERWGGSYLSWTNQARALKDFAWKRPNIMQNYIRNTYGLVSKQNLVLDVSDPAHGYIGLNSIFVQDFPWEGIYFQGNPVVLTAIPRAGYRFSGWSGGIASTDLRIKVDLLSRTTIVAQFEPDPENSEFPVIFNEICYRQDPDSDSEDWVELYNRGNQFVDISGWVLKDSEDIHSYNIRTGTLLKPGGYHVICRSLAGFETVYPSIFNYEGEMNFGFSSNGEFIRLYNKDQKLVDSVYYGISDPWPVIPEGSGYTLALTDSDFDNSLPDSWQLSGKLGTPGGDNSYALDIQSFTVSETRDVLFQNNPNPFTVNTRIVFYSGSVQPVRISIFDLNGRLIKVLANRQLESGYHEFEWIPERAGEGVFIIRAETPGSVHMKKLIKHR